MFAQLHFDSAHVLVLIAIATVLYLGLFIIQYTRYELRIRRLGVRAPVLAQNPWTGESPLVHRRRARPAEPPPLRVLRFHVRGGPGRAHGRRLRRGAGDAGGRPALHHHAGPGARESRAGGPVRPIRQGQGLPHNVEPVPGDSIFTTDGSLWHDSRGMIRPMFVKDRVSDLVVFERWTAALVRQIELQRRGLVAGLGEKEDKGCCSGFGEGVVDIQSLFYRMTLDVTTDFLLGVAVDSLNNPRDEFAEAFNEVQRLQMYLTIVGPFESIMPRGRYRAGIRAIDRFVMPYIEAALALPAAELEKRTSSTDFTFLHSVARHTRDPKVLRDQIVAVLLAGRDTTAATLSWAFYELSRYPAKVARLRAEILECVGPAPNTPSYDNLKNMPYLRHVLNETLRLYPAVPYNLRVALEDTTIPCKEGQGPPIAVLKDDVVVYSTLSMQRRRDLYPKYQQKSGDGHFADPALFEPERWEGWAPKPWTYVPFNGGPRICVGQNFALTEMAYVVFPPLSYPSNIHFLLIVRLLQKYEKIEYVGDWNAQFHEPEVVGRPGQEVQVRLYEAASAT
ncbi:cytochrome P450 [Apiospora phragmitis]|uniref:Cytochrome P450 n=1 Tax=Apiospora phragmitis TaxID=2905665 RepID=A0ABR1UTD4_9PEZI